MLQIRNKKRDLILAKKRRQKLPPQNPPKRDNPTDVLRQSLESYKFQSFSSFLSAKMASAQEKAMMSTTLACLLPSLRNKRTTVELRNESFVTGRVVQTDGFMNITMEEVTFTDALGNKSKFESFFVQNRLVR